jgi:RNA polymerase sigma-70 factor (ECF subfamily)
MTETSVQPDVDSDLLARAARGDRAAFDALLAQVEPRVRAFVRSRLRPGAGGRMDLDEIVQDTLVRAFQSIHTCRGKDLESFVRWLNGVARIAIIKASKPAHHTALEVVNDAADSKPSAGRALQREERRQRLAAAVGGLSEDHRQVLQLSRLEGLSLKEVAARLGKSPEATKKLLGRALRKLRERFGDTESFHLPGGGIGWKEGGQDA